MSADPVWSAIIEIRRTGKGAAERMVRVLRPESVREVPRAHAEIDFAPPYDVLIRLTARDTGAVRAGLNTYLGWVSLADRTSTVAESRPAPRRP